MMVEGKVWDLKAFENKYADKSMVTVNMLESFSSIPEKVKKFQSEDMEVMG